MYRLSMLFRPFVVCAAVLTLLLGAGQAGAQPGLTPGSGVSVDTDGVVSVRELGVDRRTAQRRSRAWEAITASEDLVFISLPRLFEQVQTATESGDTVPDELLYLGGMLQVRYVLVDPDGGGLVLAGPGDEVDASDPWRPVGVATGRPVLRLEDLVVALRTFGPGASGRAGVFGCSIDMPEGAQQRFVNALSAAQRDGASRREKLRRLAEAVGPQSVRFWGVEGDSRFAFALLEADVRMKRLALGLDDSPVRGLPAAVTGDDHRYTRCWFHPSYEPLKVSVDGTIYVLSGPRLALSTSRSRTDNDAQASPGARRFVERANDRMEALCGAIPAWADLANCIDLAVVATLIRTDRLHDRAGWDTGWLRDAGGYEVTELPTPNHVATLVVDLRGGYAAGGVVMSPGAVVAESRRESMETEDAPQVAPQTEDAAVWRSVSE